MENKEYVISSSQGGLEYIHHGSSANDHYLQAQNNIVDVFICNNYQVQTLNGGNERGACQNMWNIGETYTFQIWERGGGGTTLSSQNLTIPTPQSTGTISCAIEPSSLVSANTITRLVISGVTAGKTYQLNLDQSDGGWDGGNIGGDAAPCPAGEGHNDNWTATGNQLIITNICTNGNACRSNCSSNFKQENTYTIQVKDNSDGILGTCTIQQGTGGSSGGPGGRTPAGCTLNGDQGIETALGCIPTTTAGFISAFLKIALGIAGGIAFLMMAFGAIKILTSSGNPDGINAGRELIISALTGLLFIVFAVFLLRLIGIQIFQLPIPK